MMQTIKPINQQRRDFDKMLMTDIPGQNYDCDIIPDFGNGNANTGGSNPARCIIWAHDTHQDPIIRTSTDTPISRGYGVYIAALDRFFLVLDDPQRHTNCHTAHATRCNAQVTIMTEIPPQVDQYGFLIEAGAEKPILANIPAVIRRGGNFAAASTNTPGTYQDDTLQVILQYNRWSAQVAVKDFFELDNQRYTIVDIATDTTGSTTGTITLTARLMPGTRT